MRRRSQSTARAIESGARRWVTRAGLTALICTFVVYASGLLSPHVPFDVLTQVWSLPVDEHRAAVLAPAGWGWVDLAWRSDYLNYAGIVLLALVTIVCYLRVLPAFVARGDRVYALVTIVEIAVLAAAAAGRSASTRP